MCFFSYPPPDPTILSRASENNFTGLLLSKLYCTLGILFFCLGLLLQNQGKYWVNSATSMFLTPQNIIIISQIIKVLRNLKKKKKHSALTEWHKSIFWNSHVCSRREKTSELLKQYWDICHLLPSKACVNLSLIFFSYWKIIFNYYSI